MQQREPASDAWRKGGLWHDDMALNVPGLWFMSWYHVSVGPNIEMFNHVRRTAKAAGARPPVGDHRAGGALLVHPVRQKNTIVGERNMGDARLDYNDIMYRLFRQVPERRPVDFARGRPQRRHREAGEGDLPHDGQQQMADLRRVAAGRLAAHDVPLVERRPRQLVDRRRTVDDDAARDRHAGRVYLRSDESRAVLYGGNVCCTGNAITAGSFDQRKMESRNDILATPRSRSRRGSR